MFALTIDNPGPDNVLRKQELPRPTASDHEVVIEVAAAGVNRADLLQRRGLYGPPPGESELLGLEVSGVIHSVGEAVSTWKVGQAVCALLAGGGYAEFVAVDAGSVLPVPNGVDLIDAAGLPEVACTAYVNTIELGQLKTGQSVLIHGASGGVGTFAVQYAKAIGAQVFATVGDAVKAARCQQAGADLVMNYREVSFVEQVLHHTEGRGVDLVLDVVGAKYLSDNLTVLASHGRLVVIGLQGGRRAEIDLARVLAKSATVTGTTVRSRTRREKADLVSKVRAEVWPLIESGHIHPWVEQRVPWDQADQVHDLLASGSHTGKTVLTVSGH